MVLPHKAEEREGAYGLTPTDERAEVIKVCELVPASVWSCIECVSSLWPPQVFLGAHPQTGENIKMITDEVSQIQEVSRTS